ncbi:MAG TPA: hypothetical protein VNU27_12615, partial [Candidatus Acidoferrum sp.]|nr:hypothetical protein [Candidatus Acidoferrum sp.]
MCRWKLTLGIATLPAMVLALSLGPFALSAAAAGRSASGQSLCIAHHPQDFVWYTAGCTGHDEPEID